MDKTINRLKDYLENQMEISVTETELEDIMDLAIKQDSWDANKGHRWERVKDNDRELAFYEQWLEENEPKSYMNNGQGILQDLFIERNENATSIGNRKWVEIITNRDRMIVATIIQWLGSNVGFSFLHEALRRCGYTIVQSERKVV
jgi:hypothetical protein